MTTSSWDKNQIEENFAHCVNLSEIISHIETEFSKRGEVICEISINGVMIDEAGEAQFATNVRETLNDISVRANTPHELILGALKSAATFIPDLSKACISTSDLFRRSDLARANRSFTEAIDGCQWLVETLVHVRGAASNTEGPLATAERWVEAERQTNRIVGEVAAAFTTQDFVLVADLLEYEMPGVLEIWQIAISAELERRA